MRSCVAIVLFVLVLPSALPAAPQDEKPTWIKITVPTKPSAERALAHPLQADPLDSEPGNAATLWLRAGQLASRVKPQMTEEQDTWLSGPPGGLPLDRLPKKAVAEVLERFAPALRVAREASRREFCDWGEAPLTLTNVNDHLPLEEIQCLRVLTRVLSVQLRHALASGDRREAFLISRTQLTLARHLGESNLLVAHLVGIAISAIALDRVEEMLAQPDCPNLYWALTDLPAPLVSVRRAIQHELNTFHRTFPALRLLEANPDTVLSQEQLVAMFADITRSLGTPREPLESWQQALLLTGIVSRYYTEARRALLARGTAPEKVEKMPTAQVVGLYFLHEYNGFRDDILKLRNLPPWQARPLLEALEKRLAPRLKEGGNPFLLLMPAIAKVDHASVRSQRAVVLLRTVEAIRLHAAHNGGQLPARLADIKVAPVPLDPATGQTFEAYYTRTDTGAKLEVPPLSPLPAWLAHHFEFSAPPKEAP